MPEDRSPFYHGWFFHKLFDPQLDEGREAVLELIPEGSTVLDIACGTGQLCFGLRSRRACRVVGVDLSLRMLRFAERSNPYTDVTFLHRDATDLEGILDGAYDFATLLFAFLDLPSHKQVRLLREALRVANRLIIGDARVPLPRNAYARGLRIVEATIGRNHYADFRRFLPRGGIPRHLA